MEFPRIYRFITDPFVSASRRILRASQLALTKWKVITIGSLSLVLLVAIAVVSFDLYKNLQERQKVEQERQKLISKVKFWESITSKYKGYRDAYFQLAVLEYQLKNFDQSKSYLQKAIEIDPNFEAARKLEKLLDIEYLR